MTTVIKRDCTVVDFDKEKIYSAIMKAMTNGSGVIKADIAMEIANEIEKENENQSIDIYKIEEDVFNKLIEKGQALTAKCYEGYRSIREYQRETVNSTDQQKREMLEGTNEYWNKENSNKNAVRVTTQRDYIAGISSKDFCERCLFPPNLVQANKDGVIHIHDEDYMEQKALHNCDLINLEDMLQNGTVISDVLIEKPHSFSTACNVATQIIAQVASSQYGGQSISLSHLAPFVDVSRKAIRKEVIEEFESCEIEDIQGTYQSLSEAEKDSMIEQIVKKRLAKEINRGIQMIQYQVITLMTTNG